MNKEEKDVIDFLRVSVITKAEKIILSKEDVKCLLNYIDEYKKRTTFFREEIYRLNKKADKLQKEFKDLELAYGLYKDRYETLQKENAELKEEIKDLIEENHKHIDYIADMKKKHEDKIRTKIKELEDIKNKNIEYCSKDYFQLERTIKVLKELLGETKDEE